MYRIIKYTIAGQEAESLQRIEDGAFIPKEPSNTDYQTYLKWLEEGNSPEIQNN